MQEDSWMTGEVYSPVPSSMHPRIRPRRSLNVHLAMIIAIIRRNGSGFHKRCEQVALDSLGPVDLSISHPSAASPRFQQVG